MSTFVKLVIASVALLAGVMAVHWGIGILDADNPQDDDL